MAVLRRRGVRLIVWTPFRGLSRLTMFPVARRRMMCGQPEQGFERNVPVEAAIVAKDEFIEIGVDVRAAQAMIRAQAPSLHQ